MNNCLLLHSLNCLQFSAASSEHVASAAKDFLIFGRPSSSCLRVSIWESSVFLKILPLRLSTGVAITDDVVDVEFDAVLDDDDSDEVFVLLYVS